jgi:capsular exopolysaccharide synthesis family protein
MANQNFVELRWVITVIRRWWWLISGLALFAAVVAYIITSILPPVYESSAMLLVNPSKNSSTNQYNDLMAGTQLALTYSQMLTDRPVLETVISDLGLKESAGILTKQITAEPLRNSQIIKLTVSDSNPERAALIANTLAQAFTRRVEELSTLRYAGEIRSAKERMDSLQAQIKDSQAQIDTLRSQKITKDVSLANKQTLLTTLQSDYRSLQNSYQDMQLTVAEVTGKVYIIEPVQVQKNAFGTTSSATAVVSIGQAQSVGGNNLTDNRLALTYGQLIIKKPLLQGVIDELSLTETTDQLSKKIGFEVVTGTQLIRFTVEDEAGLKAQLIAQSLVNAFVTQVKTLLSEPYSDRMASMQKQIKDMDGSINSTQDEIGILISEVAQLAADLDRLQTDLTAVRSDYRVALQNYEQVKTTAVQESDAVIVTEPAQASNAPSRNRMLYVVIAAFLGLAVGVGLAFILKNIDGKIRTDQDVRSALNLPLLSTIGQLSKNDEDLVMGSAPHSSIAEDFRILGNKIRLMNEDATVKTLLVTSPVPTEGKSLIVANLAISLSRIGLRIVLVDADLRLPRLHAMFGLSHDEGLSKSLCEGNLNGGMQSTGIGELNIITSGIIPSNPAELLSSPNMAKLLKELKEKSDLVLIDCPPVLVASDASILASKVDGVLLVLRAGSTESKAAKDAIEALVQVKAKLIGIVLNSVSDRKRGYNYYRKA